MSRKVKPSSEQRFLPQEASSCQKGLILVCCFVMQLVSNGVGFGLSVIFLRKEASSCRKGLILVCCFVMQLVSNGVGFGLSVMYVEIQRVFETSKTEAALVQSIFMGVMTAGGILFNPFLRRYGPGVCVSAGTFLGCIGLLASGFSTQVYVVILCTGVIAGVGLAINYLAPFIIVSLVFREKAGVPLVFLTTGCSIGQFIFPYMYEIFISTYGWRGTFMLISAVSMNCIPAGLYVYMSRHYMETVEGSKQSSGQTGGQTKCSACDTTLLSDVKILLILSACFLLASTGNTENWFLVDLMTIRGYERTTGSLFLTLIGLLNFLGRVTGVIFRMKIRVPTIYHWIYGIPLIGVGHVLILYLTDYLPLLLSCLLYGYLLGISVSQTPTVMFEAVGLKKYPSGMGLVNICFGSGNFFGGFVGGIISDSYGSYDPVFYLAIAASIYMCLASTIASILMKKEKRRQDTTALLHERKQNGVTQNGLSQNGLSQNGLTPNGLCNNRSQHVYGNYVDEKC